MLVYAQKCAGSLAGSAGEAWLWGADAPGPLGTHSHALPRKPNRAQQTKQKAAKPRGFFIPPGGGLASGEDLVPPGLLSAFSRQGRAGLLWGSGSASAFLPPRRQGCASSVCELRLCSSSRLSQLFGQVSHLRLAPWKGDGPLRGLSDKVTHFWNILLTVREELGLEVAGSPLAFEADIPFLFPFAS